MIEDTKKYFEKLKDTPYGRGSTVHCDKHKLEETSRYKKAKQQDSLRTVEVDVIISYVNEFLEAIGIRKTEFPKISNPLSINYEKIKEDNGLSNRKDIVWMKFTKDGYCGVVALSDDINFDIPSSELEYNERNKSGKWKHTTSGILIHKLKKEWDTTFVLLFPLPNIPKEYKRNGIERAIGNYLISKNVPVIDYYSHNYWFKKITHNKNAKEHDFI